MNEIWYIRTANSDKVNHSKQYHINIQFPLNQHSKSNDFYISCSISSDNILKRCIEEVLGNSIHLSTTLKSD